MITFPPFSDYNICNQLDAARLKRLEKLRKKRLQFLIVKCTCIIQKVFRASRGRIVAKRRRNDLANERLKKAKMQARFEVLARRIQRIVRGHAARRKVTFICTF